MSIRKGTTLLELVIAIGIIITGILTLIGLIVRSINVGTRSKNELTALGLAQEGIEAIHNIRDANNLEVESNLADSRWDLNLYFENAGSYDYSGVPLFTYANTSAALPVWSLDFSPNDMTGDLTLVKQNLTSKRFFQDANAPDAQNVATAFRRILVMQPICTGATPKDTEVLNNFILSKPETEGPIGNIGSVGWFIDALSNTNTCVSPSVKVGIRVASIVTWVDATKGKSFENVVLTQDLYDWR